MFWAWVPHAHRCHTVSVNVTNTASVLLHSAPDQALHTQFEDLKLLLTGKAERFAHCLLMLPLWRIWKYLW